ncbi:MAG: four-carbon acid sugar kinase family protein [Alcaligenaceae bacterium]|nr:four-carbon acid sugar kinase family protein [Alcaligenaceae bacterium]
MSISIGCIADDFTGATDVAGMLVRAGMRTVQTIGVPSRPLPARADAVVIALKSRTCPAHIAVADTLEALAYLRDAGCRQIYFKYCSTFDSTEHGNIGPVIDALMGALDASFTIACPAFPENNRTTYKGHLFVGDTLLSESGMRHHPLTPMTDSNLVRVLQRQTARPVGLIDFGTVAKGAQAIRDRMAEQQAEGIQIAIVDALSNADLLQIGAAGSALPLLTGGSGLALGLPQNFPGFEASAEAGDSLQAPKGLRAILCGSCSQATRAQLADLIARGTPAYAIDPARLINDEDLVADALSWASTRLPDGPVAVYATAEPERVQWLQERLGVEQAGAAIEQTLAGIAQGLVNLGVRQLIVAGGETSGAVVTALEIPGLLIGPQIDPGVPWTISLGDKAIALALKSGNFGSVDFFSKAWDHLP